MIAVQCSHWPQGSVVGPPVPSGPMQFMPLAMIRAVVVLPVPADARHDEGLGDAVGQKRVFQRADHRLLPDQIGEGFGPVFPGQHLVGLRGRVGHREAFAGSGFGNGSPGTLCRAGRRVYRIAGVGRPPAPGGEDGSVCGPRARRAAPGAQISHRMTPMPKVPTDKSRTMRVKSLASCASASCSVRR